MDYAWWGWKPRPSVGEQRAAARREKARLEKAGRRLEPVVIEGRGIARTFWGTAWCANLESYSDYENRLPRGRSYVRNGLVLHLAIAAGSVEALVRGTALYDVTIRIRPVAKARWEAICRDSAGAIDSLVALLQGRFSKAVMERLCRQSGGLFPAPADISFACSCPDWASMCKHVAAVLYGVGARLDERPELLFRLREVDEHDLITRAASGVPLVARRPAADRVLAGANLSELFGLQMAGAEAAASAAPAAGRARSPSARERKGPKPGSAAKPASAPKPGRASRRSAAKASAAKRARRSGGGSGEGDDGPHRRR